MALFEAASNLRMRLVYSQFCALILHNFQYFLTARFLEVVRFKQTNDSAELFFQSAEKFGKVENLTKIYFAQYLQFLLEFH